MTLNKTLLREVFDAQAATALRLRSSTAKERVAKIRKLRDAVIAHTEDWYRAAYLDFKKPQGEVDLAEILPVCVEANDAIRNLKKWMRPHRVWPTMLTLGMRSHVQYSPRGRCLIIGPFNYPVNLTLGPLVSAMSHLLSLVSGTGCLNTARLYDKSQTVIFLTKFQTPS